MPTSSTKKYVYGLGRRKTASARVRLYPDEKFFLVNDQEATLYFKPAALAEVALSPLKQVGLTGKVGISARTVGGGVSAQAEAVRLGISRALILLNPEFKTSLKSAGFLTRDPREKERKKYGLKRARRAPQWSKR